MREPGLQGACRGRMIPTAIRDDDHDRASDQLQRDFTAAGPNERWVADFTHVATWPGIVYVASRDVLGCPVRRRAGSGCCPRLPLPHRHAVTPAPSSPLRPSLASCLDSTSTRIHVIAMSRKRPGGEGHLLNGADLSLHSRKNQHPVTRSCITWDRQRCSEAKLSSRSRDLT